MKRERSTPYAGIWWAIKLSRPWDGFLRSRFAWTTLDVAGAAKVGDIVMILINDEVQRAVYEADIKPNLEAGNALATVLDQLAISVPAILPTKALTIAYEPVWAIGTGKVATAVEIAEMHLAIRRWLDETGFAQTEILYGGSVKPGNAAEIFAVPHVDGALVGGASLVAADFAGICAAAAG